MLPTLSPGTRCLINICWAHWHTILVQDTLESEIQDCLSLDFQGEPGQLSKSLVS